MMQPTQMVEQEMSTLFKTMDLCIAVIWQILTATFGVRCGWIPQPWLSKNKHRHQPTIYASSRSINPMVCGSVSLAKNRSSARLNNSSEGAAMENNVRHE